MVAARLGLVAVRLPVGMAVSCEYFSEAEALEDWLAYGDAMQNYDFSAIKAGKLSFEVNEVETYL